MSAVPLRRNREFMLLWTGEALSGLGSQVSLVAYPLLVLATTGSPAKAGVVGFARTLPIAALALPAGVLADRVDRKRLMVACDAVRALALAVLAAAILTGAVPYALIVLVALVDGTGFVVTYVSERGALRRLVAPDQLAEAVARNESRTFAAMLAGPPLGGVLFGLGRAVPFLADAVSYAAAAAGKLLIRTDFQGARAAATPSGAAEGLVLRRLARPARRRLPAPERRSDHDRARPHRLGARPRGRGHRGARVPASAHARPGARRHVRLNVKLLLYGGAQP